jgi:hypothetical protein
MKTQSTKTAARKAPAKAAPTKSKAPVKSTAPLTKKPAVKQAKPVAKVAKTSKPAAPAKKVSAAPKLKARTEQLSSTQLVSWIAEELGIPKADVKDVLAVAQEYVTSCLMYKGVGQAKLLGWNFKSTVKPAQRGGKKVPNPFKPGETMITKSRPMSLRLKATPLKAVKDDLAI